MLLDILYPDWIQNQKSYIENMLFIILTYHEINRNSIFAPLHLNLSVTIHGQCSGRCFPQGDAARCEAKSRVGQCQNAIYCILYPKGQNCAFGSISSWPPGDFHAFGLKTPGGTVVHLTIDISLSFCIIVLYGTVLYRTIYHAFLPQNRSRIYFIKKEAVMNALSDTLTTSWLFHQLYSRKIGESASRYGVSKTEADILLFLCNNPGFDTARDIVNIRGIAKSYVSKSIEILVQKQYLTTSVDRRDRRITHLRLTEEANAALTDLRKTQEEIFALITQKIPEERKKEVNLAFRQITENIKEALEK